MHLFVPLKPRKNLFAITDEKLGVEYLFRQTSKLLPPFEVDETSQSAAAEESDSQDIACTGAVESAGEGFAEYAIDMGCDQTRDVSSM